jgi:hypothetical protein
VPAVLTVVPEDIKLKFLRMKKTLTKKEVNITNIEIPNRMAYDRAS